MTAHHMIARQAARDSNQRLADAVGDHLHGQQAAIRLVTELRDQLGDGYELAQVVLDLPKRSEAYVKGFCRALQKRLTEGATQ